jgi:serine/threonine protein kinase
VFHKGDQIGTYTLIEKLGKGSFGEVWLAEEKTAISTHRAALKLPNEEDVDLEGIRQEADVWESVKGHPNILPIIKADIHEGQIYIASEYAPDGSLSEWLKQNGGKAPSVEIAVKMTLGILAGLEHLHSKGVIHRDLKPANILLQADTPRIADFGIARLTQATNAGSTLSAGTPSYMAPECFYSIRSEQTDIWSVGVIFHKLLSGKLPFSQPDQVSLMNAILNGEPEISRSIPERLRQIIRKALQKDTAERYQKAAEMREDLSNFSFEVLEDEDTIMQAAAPVEPKFEKEEVTVVRPKTPQLMVAPVDTTPEKRHAVFTIAVFFLLAAAGAALWGAFHLTGESNNADPQFSESLNESNINSGSANTKDQIQVPSSDTKTTDDTTNLPVAPVNPGTDVVSTEGETSEDSGQNKSPAATPFTIQPDEETLKVTRPQPAKTAVPIERVSPSPAQTKSPAPTPILIPPDQPGRPIPPPRNIKPTPKPTEKPAETPPPLKNEDSDGK